MTRLACLPSRLPSKRGALTTKQKLLLGAAIGTAIGFAIYKTRLASSLRPTTVNARTSPNILEVVTHFQIEPGKFGFNVSFSNGIRCGLHRKAGESERMALTRCFVCETI